MKNNKTNSELTPFSYMIFALVAVFLVCVFVLPFFYNINPFDGCGIHEQINTLTHSCEAYEPKGLWSEMAIAAIGGTLLFLYKLIKR